MGAAILLSIFLFVGGYQLASRRKLHLLVCVAIAVLIPFALTLTLRGIYGFSLFTLYDALTLIPQFIITFFVYRKSQDIDSLRDWFFLGVAGLVLVIMLIPQIVNFILY